MMKLKAAHEKALRATLRVTLFAALGACGGGGSSGATRTTGPTNEGKAVAAESSPTTDAECRAALAAAFPNGDDKWYSPNDPTARVATDVSDAALVACCDGLSTTGSDEDYRQLGCCSTKFNGGHCTPWGPPMPPAMRARA